MDSPWPDWFDWLHQSDAQETITNLVANANAGMLHATTDAVGHDAMIALLSSRDIPFTTWEGWELLDAYERQLGEDLASCLTARPVSASRWLTATPC